MPPEGAQSPEDPWRSLGRARCRCRKARQSTGRRGQSMFLRSPPVTGARSVEAKTPRLKWLKELETDRALRRRRFEGRLRWSGCRRLFRNSLETLILRETTSGTECPRQRINRTHRQACRDRAAIGSPTSVDANGRGVAGGTPRGSSLIGDSGRVAVPPRAGIERSTSERRRRDRPDGGTLLAGIINAGQPSRSRWQCWITASDSRKADWAVDAQRAERSRERVDGIPGGQNAPQRRPKKEDSGSITDCPFAHGSDTG
ncbi:Hypothetical Protein RSKD131_2813 [Cereibacter sphaeroides KD131]|nr:Hypothetical Protein RSKD131_2813 [Cereibacter sphaeroides KD131]